MNNLRVFCQVAPFFIARFWQWTFIASGGPKAHENSVESHVIPAKAGIQFLPDMDPRFRGGEVLTFISLGGPQAHVHSE
jgi:hypothetical protein